MNPRDKIASNEKITDWRHNSSQKYDTRGDLNTGSGLSINVNAAVGFVSPLKLVLNEQSILQGRLQNVIPTKEILQHYYRQDKYLMIREALECWLIEAGS